MTLKFNSAWLFMPGGITIRFMKWQDFYLFLFTSSLSVSIGGQCRYRVAALFQLPSDAKFVWADSDVTGGWMPKCREFLFLYRCCRCRVVALSKKPWTLRLSGQIVVSLVNGRPSAENFSNADALQEWTKATDVQLRMIRTKTLLGHLMAVARRDPTVTRRVSLGGWGWGGGCKGLWRKEKDVCQESGLPSWVGEEVKWLGVLYAQSTSTVISGQSWGRRASVL